MISIRIDGLAELQDSLGNAPSELRESVKNAISKSVDAIIVTAHQLVPRKTGNLASSILPRIENSGFTGIVYQDSGIAIYGRAQEYGTIGMTINGRSRLGNRYSYIGNIPPHPYLNPAFYENQERIKGYFEEVIGNVVLHVAGRA